jgi:mono/diheme cytochrome c family protein
MRIALVVLLVSGCTGLVDGWGSDPTPPAADEPDAALPPTSAARAKFDQDVLPLVNGTCAGCHGGSPVGPAWMKPDPDVYSTMVAYPHLLELDSPATSMLLTKGQHQGPAWSVEQAATILEWIQLEHDEHPTEMVVETGAVDIVAGPNTLALDMIGSTGSSVTFTAQKLTYGLYLSKISVTAGPEGIHFKHPLFVTWNGTTPTPDAGDSFDTVEMDLAAGKTGSVGGGLLMLANVGATDQLSISFKQISKSIGTGTTTLAGCKVVTSFTSNARPPLSTNCVTCHGGANSGATSAVDMTKINDTSATGQASACGQILGRVNLTTPDASGILLAPDPASGVSHPFKFAATAYPAFKTSMTTWISAEKAAP